MCDLHCDTVCMSGGGADVNVVRQQRQTCVAATKLRSSTQSSRIRAGISCGRRDLSVARHAVTSGPDFEMKLGFGQPATENGSGLTGA